MADIGPETRTGAPLPLELVSVALALLTTAPVDRAPLVAPDAMAVVPVLLARTSALGGIRVPLLELVDTAASTPDGASTRVF